MKLLPSLCAAVFLVGCSSVNMLTAAKMSRLDPLTTHPGDIAAYLTLPDDVRIPPGGVTLSIKMENTARDETLAQTFALNSAPQPDGTVAWQLSPQDQQDLRTLQDTAMLWKSEAPKSSNGSFSLLVTPCAFEGAPDPNGEVSADISMDGGASRAPFVSGLTIAKIMAETEAKALPLCAH